MSIRIVKRSKISSDPQEMGFKVVKVAKSTPQDLGALYREMKEESDVYVAELEPFLDSADAEVADQVGASFESDAGLSPVIPPRKD